MKGLRNKSILVIDDDAGLLRALNKVLSGEGATVTAADWAGDGIEILSRREKYFDLVITDLQMPFVNGLTIVSTVHQFFPTLPVVVLTAFANPEIRTACLEQHAVAFLEKPMGSQELIAALEAALRVTATKRGPSSLFPENSQRATRPINSCETSSSSPEKSKSKESAMYENE